MKYRKIKTLRKLHDFGYIKEKHIISSRLTFVEELLAEEMKTEKEVNDKIIHELKLKKLLSTHNIIIR